MGGGPAPENKAIRLIVWFLNEEDRQKFSEVTGIPLKETTKSVWFPHRPRTFPSMTKVVEMDDDGDETFASEGLSMEPTDTK